MSQILRILIVDDDSGFRQFTSMAFEQAGFQYEVAEDGEQGLQVLADSPPGHFDLVLLDVDLPQMSGWDLLMDVRERGDEVPVIMVTGVSSKLTDRVRGLELGADDFLVKPVEYEELIARAQAVVRRRKSLPTLQQGELAIDLARRHATRGGHRLNLTPREFDVLLALFQARGGLVSREELLRDVWDMDFDPETNLVEVHVMRIRKKLALHGPPILENVRGEGYRLAVGEAPPAD